MSPLEHVKKARFWVLRVNWRVGFALAMWLAAPRLGLEPSSVSTVREAAASVMVLAFLAWANQNGRRGDEGRTNTGLLGVRGQGDEGEKGE